MDAFRFSASAVSLLLITFIRRDVRNHPPLKGFDLNFSRHVTDNAINLRHLLVPMLDRALADHHVDALIVPVENGELICRKL